MASRNVIILLISLLVIFIFSITIIIILYRTKVIPPLEAPLPQQDNAKYMLTFRSDWGNNANIHAPKNPHTGNFFFVVHNGNASLFSVGRLASLGIKNTSMFGTIDDLHNMYDRNPNVLRTYSAPSISTPGEKSVVINADSNYSHLSFSTMIAESPDWFTGIPNSIDLKSQNNQWIQNMTIQLYAYDAGTDSGMEFKNMPDIPTIPPKPVMMIRGEPLFNNNNVRPIAQLIIRKI
jgi:hypothetical protein